MKHTKQKKIEYLFSEIGMIEDNLVHEAMTYLPARRRRPALLVAASLVLMLTVALSAFAIASIRNDDANANGDIVDDGNDMLPDKDSEGQWAPDTSSLDSLLVSSRDNASYTTLSVGEQPEYRDGKTYLVWQYEDSDELCVSRALTSFEISSLSGSIGKGAEVGEQSPSLSCKVWILTGDGAVISPYLKQSSGNVGVTVFDYDPEIIPNDAFVSCVSDILES